MIYGVIAKSEHFFVKPQLKNKLYTHAPWSENKNQGLAMVHLLSDYHDDGIWRKFDNGNSEQRISSIGQGLITTMGSSATLHHLYLSCLSA